MQPKYLEVCSLLTAFLLFPVGRSYTTASASLSQHAGVLLEEIKHVCYKCGQLDSLNLAYSESQLGKTLHKISTYCNPKT
ncbi:MAG: hypothetical protein ACI8ZB_003884 [Desulforhopalus sp.]|jgi:hypothetical protein